MQINKLVLYAVVLMLLPLITPCRGMSGSFESGNGSKVIVSDMAGRQVVLPRKIKSIATLGSVPVLNGFLFAFGEGEKIVSGLPDFARSSRYKYQTVFAPSLVSKPQMQGKNREPVIEELLKAAPDVVFTMDRETVELLEKNGLTVVFLAWRQPEDVKQLVRLLGEVFSKRSTAEAYCLYFDKTVTRVKHDVSKIPVEKRPKVLYCSLKNLTQQHLIAEWWIETAGGISVTNNGRKTESFTFSLEQLFVWDPDIIIVATQDDLKEIYRDSRYSKLKAVTSRRVFVAPIAAHLWANRTIEQPLTVLWAARTFFPNEIKGLDLQKEVQEFYRKFFNYRLTTGQATEILNGLP